VNTASGIVNIENAANVNAVPVKKFVGLTQTALEDLHPSL
jgi:hypothetical protein